MDMNKQSAGRVPLRVNNRIAAIKLTIVLDKLNIYNLKLFSFMIHVIFKTIPVHVAENFSVKTRYPMFSYHVDN